jgi:hypothetical protein
MEHDSRNLRCQQVDNAMVKALARAPGNVPRSIGQRRGARRSGASTVSMTGDYCSEVSAQVG